MNSCQTTAKYTLFEDAGHSQHGFASRTAPLLGRCSSNTPGSAVALSLGGDIPAENEQAYRSVVFLLFGTLISVKTGFIQALRANEVAFGVELSEAFVERLADHYELVMEHNPLLHLVGPMSAEEFAVRHVLESLTMLEFLPHGARFTDVGSGAGFPAIPCLIAREDLSGVLIESKEKKVGFLRTAIAKCELEGRSEVIAKQFSETPRPDVSYVSCRALDKFSQHLPKLLKWSGDCTLLFFGGPMLGEEMQRLGLSIQEKLMPMSERRYLFVAKRASATD